MLCRTRAQLSPLCQPWKLLAQSVHPVLSPSTSPWCMCISARPSRTNLTLHGACKSVIHVLNRFSRRPPPWPTRPPTVGSSLNTGYACARPNPHLLCSLFWLPPGSAPMGPPDALHVVHERLPILQRSIDSTMPKSVVQNAQGSQHPSTTTSLRLSSQSTDCRKSRARRSRLVDSLADMRDANSFANPPQDPPPQCFSRSSIICRNVPKYPSFVLFP